MDEHGIFAIALARIRGLHQIDEYDIYDLCRCDRTRRVHTSIDGYNLRCDKCIICGLSGHHRQMPGTLKPYSAGWCDYHYGLVFNTPPKTMRNMFYKAGHDPARVALLICGNDMGAEYHAYKEDTFFADQQHNQHFHDDLLAYQRRPVGGDAAVIGAYMCHFPETMPYESIMKLTDRFLWDVTFYNITNAVY